MSCGINIISLGLTTSDLDYVYVLSALKIYLTLPLNREVTLKAEESGKDESKLRFRLDYDYYSGKVIRE